MIIRRAIQTVVFAWASITGASAQLITPQAQPLAPEKFNEYVPIHLVVARGAVLQIALDREVRVRKVGQTISGRIMQPVYVLDHKVIPVGTLAIGRISGIEEVKARARLLSALNADFTPPRKVTVAFDQLVLPDGSHLELHANVVDGSGQVVRFSIANEHKSNLVKDALALKMAQARAQWQSAMLQVESPGRMHLAVRYAVTQLPVHPQYIDAGALYSAEVSQPLDCGTQLVSSSVLAPVGVPPAGSLAHAVLLTPLSSATAQKGSDVDAELSQPIIDQAHLILPAGTHIQGVVLQVRRARKLHRNGQLRIAFRNIVLPDGAVRPVDAKIQGVQSDVADNARIDSEGGTQSTPSKTRYLATGMSVTLGLIGSGGRDDVGNASPVAGGATGFKLVGIVVGAAFRSHTYGILMSAYGGSRSIYTNFLGKGRDLVFPKFTMMEIGFGARTSPPMPAVSPGQLN
jgi:hypothetical protein